ALKIFFRYSANYSPKIGLRRRYEQLYLDGF
ncbi:MAG: hypothetical protein ACJASY_000999, partial [Halioglobus sp.]